MKKAIITIAIPIFLLFSRPLSLAWSSPGHMTIAAIAYRELSADQKHAVSELLKNHPNYSNWKTSYDRGVPGLDLETYVFMRASSWPDEIRRRGNPYDHPEWHYIDYPLEPPLFPAKPAPFPTNDILYGIAQSEKMLRDIHSSPEIRAVYLSWIIHLVGDIHQPLHCSALVNDDYPAPMGDKGGNNFYVRPAEAAVNLHSIWDKALGAAVNPREQYNYAIGIRAEYPRTVLPELSKARTPESWSEESRGLAIEAGYLCGKLKGSKQRESAPELPKSYTQNLKTVAERRGALAGYRLADEIITCLQ